MISEDEWDNFENFLELKGVQRYKKVEAALIGKIEKITYLQLSHHYRYDVKLRRKLYMCFSLLEVALKAYISNRYHIENLNEENFERKMNESLKNNGKIFKLSEIEKKKNEIIFSDAKVNTLFDYLENCDMSQLNKIVLHLSNTELKTLFPNYSRLKENLNAARFLRNLVFHHILLLNTKLKQVYLGEMMSNGLKANILNVVQLIPERARKNITNEINACLIIDETIADRSLSNQYKLLDEYRIEL
jgi:hypothetical protein